MTVTAGANNVILQGDGITGPPGSPFSLGTTFIGVNAQYISVIYTDADGLETVLIVSQYTLALTPGNPPNWGKGGTIVYPLSGPAIADGTTLTVVRTLPLAQATVLQNQASYGATATATETALDLIVLELQQIATNFERALVAPPTDPAANLVIPNALQRALQMLGFDADGLPIAAQPSSALVSTVMQPVVAASTLAAARLAMGIDISALLPIGMEATWPCVGAAPSLWLYEEGGLINRVDFPELFSALAPSLTGVVSNTSNSVTGLATTRGWVTGWPIEGPGIPGGTTIAAVTGSTSISMSNPATADGVAIRVFPYGAGDGVNTFQLPDGRGQVYAGLDTGALHLTGATAINKGIGASDVTLVANNLPAHVHPIDNSAFTHKHDTQTPLNKTGGATGASPTGSQFWFGAAGLADDTSTDATGINTTQNNVTTAISHNNIQPTQIRRFIIYAGRNAP